MRRVPIDVQNIDFIRLDLSRHYLQIDCDFVCYIVLNPSGEIPVGGTDVCAFHVGAWQIDAWKFLTKDFAQIPGFSACLVWDKTLITERAKAPQVAESDIDTANSISSLKGQPVNITGFSLADGESLKVSTLDEEWCNIRPYPVNGFKDVFKIQNLFYQIKVGDVLDLNKIPADYLEKVSDTSYKITAPLFSFLFTNGGFIVDKGKVLRVEYVAQYNKFYCFRGVCVDYNCVVTVDGNNIVTDISFNGQYWTVDENYNPSSGTFSSFAVASIGVGF